MYPKSFFIKAIYVFALRDPILEFCIVGIVALWFSYCFQKMLLAPMKPDMKKFGRDVAAAAKRGYLSVAWAGWSVIMLGIAAVEMAVLKVSFIPVEKGDLIIFAGIFIMFFGIGINFRNYMQAYMTALREKLS